MSKKKQELVEQKSSEVAAYEQADEWGQDTDFSAQDMVISKILPMQGLSKLVTDRKAQLGEFRDSVNGTLMGSIDEPMEFIPFKVDKLWVKTITSKGKTSFEGIEPITRDNENAPREEQLANGDYLHRDYTYYVYCLLPKDVEEGQVIPYIISLKRTSIKAGKKVMTQMFVRNKMAGKTPASWVMQLTGKLTSNDKGTFVVLDVNTMHRPTSNEELSAAFDMFKLIKQGDTKIDHSDEGGQDKPGNYANENMEF